MSTKINEVSNEFRVGVYIVRGDFPYKTADVTNIATGKTVKLNQQELIKFTEFRFKV